MARIQVIQLDDEAAKYLPWARRKAEAIDRARRDAGVPTLSKTLSIGGDSLVFIKASDEVVKLYLTAGKPGSSLYLYTAGDDCACDGTPWNRAQMVIDRTDLTGPTVTDLGGGSTRTTTTRTVYARIRPVEVYNNVVVWEGAWQDASYVYKVEVVFTPASPGSPGSNETRHVYGGTIHTHDFGDFTVDAASNTGFDVTGSTWYVDNGDGTLAGFDAATIQAILGDTGPVTFTLDGTEYDITATGSGTPPTPESTVTTVTQTWTKWLHGSNVKQGSYVTVDQPPSTSDTTTLTAVTTFFAPYPDHSRASTCDAPSWSLSWSGSGSPVGFNPITYTSTLSYLIDGVVVATTTGHRYEYPDGTIVIEPEYVVTTSHVGFAFGVAMYSPGTFTSYDDVTDVESPTAISVQAQYDAAYNAWLASEEQRVRDCEDAAADRVNGDLAGADDMSAAYQGMLASAFAAPLASAFERLTPPAAGAKVTVYLLEYDYTDSGVPGTSSFPPGSAVITRVRVKSGRKVPLWYGADPRPVSGVSKFLGRTCEVSSFVGNAVAMLVDAGADFDAEFAAQKAAFEARLTAAGGWSGLTDKDKVMALLIEGAPTSGV